MPTWEQNKKLWRDEELFEQYHWGALAFQKAFEEQIRDPEVFLKIADHLDTVMQQYEDRYESIKDPLFFWVFSTVNALYLLAGGREMVDSRVQYVLNGYKEGFGKHSKYPSYPKNLIGLALDFMNQIAPKDLKEWIKDNQNFLIPVQE
jgi:hypothetical protein